MGQFQNAITVQTLVEGIENRKYFLPSIQREFVWGTERIEKLFDSLMRDLPIGSFLFWEVPPEKVDDFQFYEFLRDYHELNHRHNNLAEFKENEKYPFQAILDGQQRMTSLYIGLKGSFSEKIKYKSKDSVQSYQRKELYVNLLDKPDDPELELMYEFKFLTPEEAANKDESHFWFKVGNILKPEMQDFSDIMEYMQNNGIATSKLASKILGDLSKKITVNPTMNAYVEKSNELDKVLNIFIRVNSGGVILSPSDLLLSFATAQLHGKRNARDEINYFVDSVNDIGGDDNFALDKDVILKAFLFLCDLDVKFKADNFNKDNMEKINEHWEESLKAIELTVKLIDSFGFNKSHFSSNNSLIPIAYYIFKQNHDEKFLTSKKFEEDRERIRHWFITATITGMFRSSTDSTLNKLRGTLQKNPISFPLKEMLGYDEKVDIPIEEGIIQNIIDMEYKDKYILMALSTFYHGLEFNKKHLNIDHVFPKNKCNSAKKYNISDEDTDFYKKYCNSIVNLQLLDDADNKSKGDKFFDEWLNERFTNEKTKNSFKNQHLIPDIDLSFNNFKMFIHEREELIRQELKKQLKSWQITN